MPVPKTAGQNRVFNISGNQALAIFQFIKCVGLGLFTYYFLWRHLAEKSAHSLLLVSMGCFGVAMGLDFIEGLEPEHPLNIYTWLDDYTNLDDWTLERFDENAYGTLPHFSKSLEEAIEMFAHTLI